jgi:2-polyprenyl-6-methoxyphenol hydroxylase-like FAD-dependent oxidoreductase
MLISSQPRRLCPDSYQGRHHDLDRESRCRGLHSYLTLRITLKLIDSQATGSEKESWSNTINASEVLEGLDKVPGPEKWAPIFKDLVRCTPANTIINFELLWRNPQPSWTSPGARVIQIGDAAHSFLPASGNGATQAIEDAISLATCLQKGGKDNIPQSVHAHIRFR